MPPLCVLFINDSDDEVALLLQKLYQNYPEITSERVNDPHQLSAALSHNRWHIILADYQTQSLNVLEALTIIESTHEDVPLIIVSEAVRVESILEAMRAGADDFFTKDNLSLLIPAIEREVMDAEERHQRRVAEAALRESEQRFRSVVEQSTDGIILTDEAGRIVEWNVALEDMTGVRREEALGQTIWDMQFRMAPDELRSPENYQRLKTTLEHGFRGRLLPYTSDLPESIIQRPDGKQRVIQTSVFPIQSDDHWMAVSFIRDVTDYRLSKDNISLLNQELKRRHEELVAVHEISKVLASTLDLQTIFHVMYEEVAVRLLNTPHFVVALYDTATELISCHYAIVDHEKVDPAQFPVMPLGTGPTSDTIRSREVQLLDLRPIRSELKTQGRMHQIGDERLPATALYVPLLSGDGVMGVLSFQSYQPNAFDQTHVALVSTIATQAAIALQNALLYTQVREHANELTALYNATSVLFKAETVHEMAQQIVEAVVREFGQADCGLLLIDADQNRMVRVARTGQYLVQTEAAVWLDGVSLVAESARLGELVYAPDVAQHSSYVANVPTTQSELVVPLKTANGVIGVLDLQSSQLHAFSERDRRVVLTFAERAAQALENMQLYEQINQYAAHLETRVNERTAELNRAKVHVEAILNHSHDGIMVVDRQLRCQEVNPAFVRMFGYERIQQLIGRPLAAILNDENLIDMLGWVFQQQEPHRIEVVAQRQDGTVFDADVALAPITNVEAQQVSVICSWRDITERKQMELDLRQALEKERVLNEMKTRFVSTVSHEFRTPLATIQAAADVLHRYYDRMDTDRRQAQFGKIRLQIQHLIHMLDGVLTLQRSDRVGLKPQWETVDFAKLCQEIVDEIGATSKQHIIHLAVTRNNTRATTDPNLVRQIIGNLVTNAIKYSPPDRPIDVVLFAGQEQTLIQVRDQGIGIPEDEQQHLFTDFFRASNANSIPGTGLGLTIVRRATEALGGEVSFESTVGQGTTFTVILPTFEI
ncbi:MAG: PAS domain S-box protein [Anaerolineales bacterium]|nr:PAS domain S-box protein [Anaerolineales bacterium]